MPKKRKKLSEFLLSYYKLIEESDEKELWKDINLGDFPIYQISNHGRVRRKDSKFIINPFHSYRKDNNGNFRYDRPTYLRVQLYYYTNGVRMKKHMEISRLVAINFIPIPKIYTDKGLDENSLEVNHIKGGYEIYNNFVSNLELCTTKENVKKSIETGLRHSPYGENHHNTFFTEYDVMQICECIEKGFNAKYTYYNIDLSDKSITYDHFKQNFYSIKYKKSWKFISQNYNF